MDKGLVFEDDNSLFNSDVSRLTRPSDAELINNINNRQSEIRPISTILDNDTMNQFEMLKNQTSDLDTNGDSAKDTRVAFVDKQDSSMDLSASI